MTPLNRCRVYHEGFRNFLQKKKRDRHGLCQHTSFQFVMSTFTSVAQCQVIQRLCSFWTLASDCIALSAYAVHMLQGGLLCQQLYVNSHHLLNVL